MPKKLFIIHEIIYFSKQLLFFKSAILSQKSLASSFEIHNLEGNQMYYKNIVMCSSTIIEHNKSVAKRLVCCSRIELVDSRRCC